MAKADFVLVQSLTGSQLNVLRYWQLQQDFFQAIDRLVQELERNINAVHLSRGKTNLIGVVVPSIRRQGVPSGLRIL
jgi:hypothetical protein